MTGQIRSRVLQIGGLRRRLDADAVDSPAPARALQPAVPVVGSFDELLRFARIACLTGDTEEVIKAGGS